MSFRTRLTLFFVLIVVVPMIALGVVVVRIVSDSQHAKARAQNRASAAAALADFQRVSADGTSHARALARDAPLVAALRTSATADERARIRTLIAQRGLARVRLVGADGTVLADVGDPGAIARGAVRIRPAADHSADGNANGPVTIEASTLNADRFARTASVHGVRAVVTRDGTLLASTLPTSLAPAAATDLPDHGTVTLGGVEYKAATFHAQDFGGRPTTVVVLTDTSAAASAATRGQWIALGLLLLFLLLAFAGALLISRQLHGQLERFLVAAKRIGGGDFTTTVPVEGNDEFAQLGREFNKMSSELEQRVDELADERARLRDSIQRIGATFAANLDRAALLEIGTQTIVDAVEGQCGRATIRATADGPLLEAARVGELAGAEQAIAAAEAQAHQLGDAAVTATVGETSALAAPIVQHDDDPDTAPRGIVSVARQGRPFASAERELVASLARQTGLSLENVDLHEQVQRQAVTDELTGLSNHGRFQQVIAAEAAAARRFDQPLGLVMLDIDDFKRVNDTYGHQQGDVVLHEVARVLRDCSREVDEPARYGGEELAVALQQTDLVGAEAIAERVRTAVEALELPRLEGDGTLRVTVSCGVAASADGDPIALVAAADAALYAAKRAGKNRTVRAGSVPLAAIPADEAPR
ncbi:MAG TPA: diguanylate cyclase [Conexibacter sp.]|jgi:diguanylate cyclase (GGDEF)-like protein|nr:diguanylate cyclase [Conexibacter sp.]